MKINDLKKQITPDNLGTITLVLRDTKMELSQLPKQICSTIEDIWIKNSNLTLSEPPLVQG